MSRILSDSEISSLLAEEKVLPFNWRSKLNPIAKTNRQFKQRNLDVIGDKGSRFQVSIRQSEINPMDFSVILTFVDQDGLHYQLIRFNGRHPSPHTNKVEKRAGKRKNQFADVCHIHVATERYQIAGEKITGYAEPTKAYDSLDTAIDHFVRSNGFKVDGSENKPDDQPSLWNN